VNQQADSNASRLENWEFRMMELDERLRPIARRPVDILSPGWIERSHSRGPALDEAGARPEAETLLAELSAAYAQGPEETRTAIRRLFAECRSFAWAALWSRQVAGADDLRQRLILFSMQDQGRDSRDALLTLQGICSEAAAAGVDAAPMLREVAALSSTVNRYGMGSTRDMLLSQCPAQ
jgi:hypothetical protein